MKNNLTVLIPCLNEAKTISDVLSRLIRFLPNISIIVIDNGSHDGSIEIIKRFNVALVQEPLKGKANAIRKGLQFVNTEFTLLLDADDEYYITSIVPLIEQLSRSESNSMIIGNRLKNRMLFRSRIANFLIRTCLYLRYHKMIPDCLTGLRIVPTQLLKLITSHGFELETELNILCLRKNLNIIPVDIYYSPRVYGKKIKSTDMIKLLKVVYQ